MRSAAKIGVRVEIPHEPSHLDMHHIRTFLQRMVNEMNVELDRIDKVGYADFFGNIEPRLIGKWAEVVMEGRDE